MSTYEPIRIIDTHTGGEPTRVVVAGGPALGDGTLIEQRERFRTQFDHYRTAILGEPRGSAVMVGALLCPSPNPHCLAGVIFFNEIGYLGMCGHGTIGLVAALVHSQQLAEGTYQLDTPVGVVEIEHLGNGQAAFENVPSYRHAQRVVVALADGSVLHGDIAYGGNWFFLVDEQEHRQSIELERVDQLTDFCLAIRTALRAQGITGADDGEIDHIELFAKPSEGVAHSRNFVLCPGRAYDRSPCGTGTSAKLACLAADGKLATGETWIQESIVGSQFTGSYRMVAGELIPRIAGTAYVNGEASLLLHESDPFCWGIRP